MPLKRKNLAGSIFHDPTMPPSLPGSEWYVPWRPPPGPQRKARTKRQATEGFKIMNRAEILDIINETAELRRRARNLLGKGLNARRLEARGITALMLLRMGYTLIDLHSLGFRKLDSDTH